MLHSHRYHNRWELRTLCNCEWSPRKPMRPRQVRRSRIPQACHRTGSRLSALYSFQKAFGSTIENIGSTNGSEAVPEGVGYRTANGLKRLITTSPFASALLRLLVAVDRAPLSRSRTTRQNRLKAGVPLRSMTSSLNQQNLPIPEFASLRVLAKRGRSRVSIR
jgi:hypothetical protein